VATWDETYDFVTIGSGGGAFCAALVAATHGKRCLVIEKEPKVGGSTSRSGGIVWIPANHHMAREGVADSIEDALTYMRSVVGEPSKGSSLPRREAFLHTGPKMVQFLEAQGIQFRRCDGYSDYYDDRPGGKSRGRALEVDIFDSRHIGPWAKKMNRFELSAFPARTSEFSALSTVKQTWKGRFTALKVGLRLLRQRLTGWPQLGQGSALQGRMLHAVLKRNVPVWLETPVTGLIVENNRVVGVTARREGREVRIKAEHGVLINAGGFAHNLAMRRKYMLPDQFVDYTLSNPGDTGEVQNFAIDLGADIDFMEEAIWNPVTLPPGGGVTNHVVDLTKPCAILVDSTGQRFVNEAGSYMALGQAIYKRHQEVKNIPCWAIIDSRHRNSYTWATTPPGITPANWITSGYMKKANTIEDLARQCEIDPAALRKTIDRFNGFVRNNKDEDFNRGGRIYDGYFGDPTNKPNPTLGALEHPPYYAMKVYPGDVGTAGGVITDENARVMRTDGTVIQGLYATGNSTASIMGRAYPGPGTSIASSFTFGYIAARHALGVND
jgi:3-oxosteroid 1-dehydrogenase